MELVVTARIGNSLYHRHSLQDYLLNLAAPYLIFLILGRCPHPPYLVGQYPQCSAIVDLVKTSESAPGNI